MDKQVRFNSAFRGVHAPARLHASDEMAASPTCGRCSPGGNSSNAWIPNSDTPRSAARGTTQIQNCTRCSMTSRSRTFDNCGQSGQSNNCRQRPTASSCSGHSSGGSSGASSRCAGTQIPLSPEVAEVKPPGLWSCGGGGGGGGPASGPACSCRLSQSTKPFLRSESSDIL